MLHSHSSQLWADVGRETAQGQGTGASQPLVPAQVHIKGLDALCDNDLQRISESHQQHFPSLHTALGEAGKVEGDLQQWSCAGSGAEGEGRELPGTKEHLELSALTPLPSAKSRAFSNSIISSCLAGRQERKAAT